MMYATDLSLAAVIPRFFTTLVGVSKGLLASITNEILSSNAAQKAVAVSTRIGVLRSERRYAELF